MEISNSFNYKCFKKNIGQANHFLITVLVGLDGLEDHEEINIRSSFRTTWNPKNRIASIARSREFVKKSSLAWIIDCLDSYLIECNTKPKLIYDNELIKKIDTSGHSVKRKFEYISDVASPDIILQSFVELGIAWRNNMIHREARNLLDNKFIEILNCNSSKIKENYCNLNIEQTLDNFKENKTPTFKEVASITKALIDCVRQIDQYFISNLDSKNYINEIFKYHLELQKKDYLARLKNYPIQKRNKVINNIMRQYGISQFDISDVIID